MSRLVDLGDYYILSQIYLGNELSITFQNRMDIHDRRVLVLSEIVGFIDKAGGDEVFFLRIDDDGSSYAHDLSMRLNRPEVINFPEAFIFIDEKRTTFRFRACAKNLNFRNWTERDIWLK